MKNITYSEKLKSPKWQKKRLEIMERDSFCCQICNDSENTLNVHHLAYIKGKDPWQVPNDYLVTLCEECHNKITRAKDFYDCFFAVYYHSYQEIIQMLNKIDGYNIIPSNFYKLLKLIDVVFEPFSDLPF
jgi:hypothetical protein